MWNISHFAANFNALLWGWIFLMKPKPSSGWECHLHAWKHNLTTYHFEICRLSVLWFGSWSKTNSILIWPYIRSMRAPIWDTFYDSHPVTWNRMPDNRRYHIDMWSFCCKRPSAYHCTTRLQKHKMKTQIPLYPWRPDALWHDWWLGWNTPQFPARRLILGNRQ